MTKYDSLMIYLFIFNNNNNEDTVLNEHFILFT